MGYLSIPETKPTKHHCEKPNSQLFSGSVWECDDCKKVYIYQPSRATWLLIFVAPLGFIWMLMHYFDNWWFDYQHLRAMKILGIASWVAIGVIFFVAAWVISTQKGVI